MIVQLLQLSLVAKRSIKSEDVYETSYLFRQGPQEETDNLMRKVLLLSSTLRAFGTVKPNPKYNESISNVNKVQELSF